MIFRRRPRAEEELPPEAPPEVEAPLGRPRGPWDRSETTADAGDDTYLDLGGLVVRGSPGGVEVHLQVDEATSTVAAVMLAAPDSGLELRAFAAPRNGGIWDDVRADIAAEAARHGGTATEQDGEFGTELSLVVPVRTPEGRSATQPSRIVGVEGPRWLLRGTFFGRSAVAPDPEGELETAFRSVVVVRGDGPMAPREPLPLRIPPQVSVQAEADQGR
jgi:Protein of unknown function (DUF3710)